MKFNPHSFFVLGVSIPFAIALTEALPATRNVSLEDIRAVYGENAYQEVRERLEAAIREAEASWEPVHSIEAVGTILRIEGDISDYLYEDLLRYVRKNPVERISITSGGGSVDAGINIGRLMIEKNIDIEVVGYCVSSCANYLFTAAPNKLITKGSAVIWHGNTLQLDVREFFLCGQLVSAFDGEPLSEYELAEMSSLEALLEWESLSAREEQFFSLLGIDGFIARAGQEPIFYGNFTMTVDDMNLFGLSNVNAVEDYGTQVFCERFNAAQPGWDLHCLEVTRETLAFEEKRRRYGELCSDNARLVIRNQEESRNSQEY